ncbi:MAG TPA: hypothetical protein VEI02_03815 [Planctomycetota bacterium]|nr:hypothetical protein [Planctomycetota bacterium]
MAPPPPRRFKLVLATLGYAISFAACLVGMWAVLVVWSALALTTVAYLLWTGRAAEIRRRRWY